MHWANNPLWNAYKRKSKAEWLLFWLTICFLRIVLFFLFLWITTCTCEDISLCRVRFQVPEAIVFVGVIYDWQVSLCPEHFSQSDRSLINSRGVEKYMERNMAEWLVCAPRLHCFRKPSFLRWSFNSLSLFLFFSPKVHTLTKNNSICHCVYMILKVVLHLRWLKTFWLTLVKKTKQKKNSA